MRPVTQRRSSSRSPSSPACSRVRAAAKIRKSANLHNDRYCEIFELKGAPPDSTVTVWNTIGLNDCPAEWWDNLDTDEDRR